jgi:hypothetical protein
VETSLHIDFLGCRSPYTWGNFRFLWEEERKKDICDKPSVCSRFFLSFSRGSLAEMEWLGFLLCNFAKGFFPILLVFGWKVILPEFGCQNGHYKGSSP